MEDSGQQWDFPNAWAPLQHLIIMGLYEARNIHHAVEELSFDLAEKWIRSNWKGYQELNAMFEKVWKFIYITGLMYSTIFIYNTSYCVKECSIEVWKSLFLIPIYL